MEMTKKQLDEYVDVREGEFVGAMYKINHCEFNDDDGKHFLKMDYDVLNLPEDRERDFENWLGEFVLRALQYAVDNDPLDGNGI